MNPSGTILEAGDYVVELAFRRVCDPEVLRRALTAMGWTNVVFDEPPSPSTGLTAPGQPSQLRTGPITKSIALGRVKPIAKGFPTGMHLGLGLATVQAPSTSLGRVKPAVALGRVKPAGTALGRVRQSSALGRVEVPLPVKRSLALGKVPMPPAGGAKSAALTCENIDKLDQAAWDAMTPGDRDFYNACLGKKPGGEATPTTEATPPGGGGGGGYGGGGGGGGESPPKGETPQEPAPEPMPEPEPQATPPAAEATPTPSAEETAAAPAPAEEDPLQVLVRTLRALTPGAPPTEPLPNETPDLKTLRLQNLWRRWSEWGSPFSTSPGGAIDDLAMSKVQVSGESEDSDPTRIRFIGHLDARLRLENPPGMQWVFVKPIHLGYDDAIRINVEPHRLDPGAFYEFRVLVRDKTAPTRHEVKKRLGEMGFAPMKLHLLKRNIRLPNRPSSLSMWYGIGQWLHPSTVVTVEDPFYFEQVKEIAP
jgi:hypothetical protein